MKAWRAVRFVLTALCLVSSTAYAVAPSCPQMPGFGGLPNVFLTDPEYASRIGTRLGEGINAEVYSVSKNGTDPLNQWVASKGVDHIAFKAYHLKSSCATSQARAILWNYENATYHNAGVRLFGATVVTDGTSTYLILAMEDMTKPPPGGTLHADGMWKNALNFPSTLRSHVPVAARTAVANALFAAAANVSDANAGNVMWRVFTPAAGQSAPPGAVPLGDNRYFQALAIDQDSPKPGWTMAMIENPDTTVNGYIFGPRAWSTTIAEVLQLNPEAVRLAGANYLHGIAQTQICNPLLPRPNPFGPSAALPAGGLPPLVRNPLLPKANPWGNGSTPTTPGALPPLVYNPKGPKPNPFNPPDGPTLNFTKHDPPLAKKNPFLEPRSWAERATASCSEPRLLVGKTQRWQSWFTTRGTLSPGLKDFTRSMGTNASAGLGFTGNKICAFGQALAMEQYERTAYLLDEYIFALTGGAYEARLKSLNPDNMYTCSLEDVQVRPSCSNGSAPWKWGDSKGANLIQPVDLEKKFKTITQQSLGNDKIIASLQEELDDVRSKLYLLLAKSGDTSAEEAALRAQQDQLEKAVLVYNEPYTADVEDPSDPTKRMKVRMYEVGLSFPLTPFTLEDGTVIDPAQIDQSLLDDQERLFFLGMERGRVRLPNGFLEVLRNAKAGGCTTCCTPTPVTLADIRSVWRDLMIRQKARAQQAQIDTELAAIVAHDNWCSNQFQNFTNYWGNAVRGISCPRKHDANEESEVLASLTSATNTLTAIHTECPTQYERYVRDNQSIFTEYTKVFRAAQAGTSFLPAMLEATYGLCSEKTCDTSIRMTEGYTQSKSLLEPNTYVLRKIPGATRTSFVMRAEGDGRVYKTGYSSTLQNESVDGEDYLFFNSNANKAAGADGATMFPEKDMYGDMWQQQVLTNGEALCGQTVSLAMKLKGPQSSKSCSPLNIRFECGSEPPPESCGCSALPTPTPAPSPTPTETPVPTATATVNPEVTPTMGPPEPTATPMGTPEPTPYVTPTMMPMETPTPPPTTTPSYPTSSYYDYTSWVTWLQTMMIDLWTWMTTYTWTQTYYPTPPPTATPVTTGTPSWIPTETPIVTWTETPTPTETPVGTTTPAPTPMATMPMPTPVGTMPIPTPYMTMLPVPTETPTGIVPTQAP